MQDACGKPARLFVVEYQLQAKRWRPFSIVTDNATWDAEWSRAYGGLLVHHSGSGYSGHHTVHAYAEPQALPGRIWTADGVTLTRYVRGGRRAPLRELPADEKMLRPLGYKRFARLPGNPFEDAMNVEGHIEWCSICRDRLDDSSDAPCAHLRWSDDAAQCIGSGADWHDFSTWVEQAIPALCAALCETRGIERVERLRADLRSRRLRGRDLLGWDDDIDETPRVAELWLDTLRASRKGPMREAVARTLRLVDGWLATRRAA